MNLHVEFCESSQTIELEFKEIQGIAAGEQYDGPYEITPAKEDQILHTTEKTMAQDVIVKAIPKEYGLVTYNQDKTIRIT